MSRVFIGGSRTIARLNAEVRDQLDELLSRGFQVVIGDANGADKTVQTYLASKGYRNVILYCSGDKCRNNVGNWTVRHVQASSAVKDLEYYSQKDKEMAREADQGLFLWDGSSRGTLENIRRMLDAGKPSLVYLSDSRSFITVQSREDFQTLSALPRPRTKVGRRSSHGPARPQGMRRLL